MARRAAADLPESDARRLPGVDDEPMPRVYVTRQRAIAFAVFVLSAIAFLYFVLPKIAGLGRTWDRIDTGDPAWLAVGVVFEMAAYSSYVAVFRSVFARGTDRLGWREGYQITLAGLLATRLFAAGGAGGIVLTAWALRRSGMERRVVACRMIAFLTLLYTVYMAAFVIVGIGLYTGLFAGGGAFAITIVPAILGGIVLAIVALISVIPDDIERRLERRSRRGGSFSHWLARASTVPAVVASGVRTAFAVARSRDPLALGAVAWWGFDMAVLWATLHAFGQPPPYAVIVMAYFVGLLGNLLPLPGGIGGVDGGLIGALIAFGVDSGLAVVAVLAYRVIAFWLPIVPGAIAFFALRRTVHRWQGEPSPEHGAASEPATA